MTPFTKALEEAAETYVDGKKDFGAQCAHSGFTRGAQWALDYLAGQASEFDQDDMYIQGARHCEKEHVPYFVAGAGVQYSRDAATIQALRLEIEELQAVLERERTGKNLIKIKVLENENKDYRAKLTEANNLLRECKRWVGIICIGANKWPELYELDKNLSTHLAGKGET